MVGGVSTPTIGAPATPGPTRREGPGIVALASAAFVYVTAEGLPVGLLGQLSAGLHVRPSTVGLLVTVYAGVAGLAAVPVTAWVDRLGRRQIMTGAVALLALSQFVIAAAPDYAVVMMARVVCALAHGVFWSMLAPVAARLAPAGRAGRATATAFLGNSLALVIGIPAGAALGEAIGWRGSMLALGVAAAVSGAAMRVTMPDLPATGARQDLRSVPALLRRRSLLAVCVITAVIVIGHFAAYTYITELVRRDAGLSGYAISAVLLVYGVAGIASVVAVGRIVDRRPRRAAGGCVLGVTVALAALALVAHGSVVVTVLAVAVWGAAFIALPVCLQTAVLRVAPQAADSASALYVVAFQIGIGGGALVGSTLVAAGWLGALPAVGMSLGIVATAILAAARGAFPARGAVPG
jgi:predicted MFS family arabinose efflux permease